MNKLNKTIMGIAFAMIPTLNVNADNVAMHTPANFQLMSVSPNGKWACGVYIDGSMNIYGFRWNLQGGSIEMLCSEPSTAWDVSNDGTVSGDFNDRDALGDGTPLNVPGIWRDGKWHHIEMPEGKISDGIGTGISPDGRYMTGSICVNGIYTPFIWEDGKILKKLNSDDHAVAYTVSPDGKSAGGYSTQRNRTACIWNPDNKLIYFEDSDVPQSPWNYARNFSPDGSKLLYWGGWEVENEDDVYLYSIYDTNTGERIKVKSPSYDSDLEFFDISNNGMLVGYNLGRGYIYANGEGMYIDDYLKLRDVDISHYEDFYSNNDYYVGQLPINNVVAVSEDEKVLAMLYYNKLGQPASMILKIDQNLKEVGPAEVTAKQLSGLNTVGLNWKRPVGGNAVRGYNIYRDGVKINGFLPINVLYFYDNKAEQGVHNYQISAINADGTEKYSDVITVNVQPEKAQIPIGVNARQKGIKDILAKWDTPLSNAAHKRYFDIDNKDISSLAIYMPVEVEMGVRYDKNEMAQYQGHKLSEVSFYPMSENHAWAVNVYAYGQDGKPELLASQPITKQLVYGQLNTVKLDKPVDIPSSDMVVAIEVDLTGESNAVIGAQNTIWHPGYSDLLRLKSEDDFYSAYDRALENLQVTLISWAIDLGIEKSDDSASSKQLNHYNLYLDNKFVAETTANKHQFESVADGQHTFGVEAVYSDGTKSDIVYTPVDIKALYESVKIKHLDAGSDGSSVITATWDRPVDSDLTPITYSTDAKHSRGIKGVSENGYAFMVAADYPSTMVSSYDGYKVKSFKFYPLADALFTFMLYENDKLIYELEVEDFTIGEWNEVMVPYQVIINGNSKYRLAVDCFDPEPDVEVLALDSKYPRPYVSDLFSQSNGEDWSSLYEETSATGNWMIGMEIEDAEPKELDIAGFDVLIDNKVRNEALITDNTFTYDFGTNDTKIHSIKVDTHYESLDQAVGGTVYYFHLSTAGITDGVITDIQLKRESNYLVADGAKALTVYSASGAEVAKAKGDRVNIDSLTTGVYVVQIDCEGQTVSQKINLQR